MKKILIVIVMLLFISPSFATGYKDVVRVGIRDNKFENFYYSTIKVGATHDYEVYSKADNSVITTLSPDKMVKFDYNNGKLAIYSDSLIKSDIKTPIGIRTEGLLKVQDLKRAGKPALYRGEFEISIANNGHTGFNLINVVSLEDYLRGVVPNEMPVSFGLEALKAQTVAARNYTLRPRSVIYHNFDVCDSVQSQVYYGANTEQYLSDRAVNETKGLFALYKGKLILALYSSTAGGITENYENVFLAPDWQKKSVEPIPYLVGKSDKKYFLCSEEDVENFYSEPHCSYDSASKYYRWQVEWGRLELQDILRKTLASNAKSGFVSPAFNPNDFGNIKDIRVVSRGVSGKVIALEIITDNDTYVVKKELIIRKIFTKNGKMLNSANIVIKNTYDDCGNVCTTRFIGGGFGHGVGMSQYGAGSMAADGKKFNDILQHYYTGVSIGTFPTVLTSKSENIVQEFSSPTGKGVIIIENPDSVENFSFNINGVEIVLNKKYLDSKCAFKLDKYMGQDNRIEYFPLNESKKSLKVWVEIYRSKE